LLIAVASALAAAAMFALASVLQQRAARAEPTARSMSWRLLADLVHRRLWLAGVGSSAAAFGLQALALAYGTLILVQPIIVLELAFALPLAARLGHGRLGSAEWLATGSVMVGLAMFLTAASPSGSGREPSNLGWLMTIAGVAAVGVVCQLVARSTRNSLKATLLGVGAGTLFGLLSALLKSTTDLLANHGVLGALSSWQLYTLAVASLLGELFAQSAYQAGPLPESLPIMDVLEPAVAVAIAVGAFGERIGHSPLALIVEAVGVALALAGVVALDRSPLILSLNEKDPPPTESSASKLT
jgi:drug/metabolite transporter (DMT)-like permease